MKFLQRLGFLLVLAAAGCAHAARGPTPAEDARASRVDVRHADPEDAVVARQVRRALPAALALAGRSAREVLTLAVLFFAGQVAAVVIVPHTAWQPAPRFVEAAAALTVAYMAVEILFLPKAGSRWLVALVLGAFHGLYFHLFLQTTSYQKTTVLAGAAAAEAITIVALAATFLRLGRAARVLRPVQVAASGLFVFGMVWFFLRLRS